MQAWRFDRCQQSHQSGLLATNIGWVSNASLEGYAIMQVWRLRFALKQWPFNEMEGTLSHAKRHSYNHHKLLPLFVHYSWNRQQSQQCKYRTRTLMWFGRPRNNQPDPLSLWGTCSSIRQCVMVTAIPSIKYPIPSELGSQTATGVVSTAVGDHAGIRRVVTFFSFFFLGLVCFGLLVCYCFVSPRVCFISRSNHLSSLYQFQLAGR